MKKEYDTQSRKKIKQYIERQKNCIFSVDDVYQYLMSNDCLIGKTTVYRNMNRLVNDGVLLRLRYADEKKSMYQYIENQKKNERYIYLRCMECGKMIRLKIDYSIELEELIMNKYGFKVNGTENIISGLCKDCHQLMIKNESR